MGSSVSKTEPVQVFTPKANVEFSQEFLDRLDNTEESNYARSQLSEKFIQKQVSSKLNDLHKQAQNSLEKSYSTLKSTPDNGISSSSLDAKLEDVTAKLSAIKSSKYFQAKEGNEAIVSARSDVIKCLVDNKGKPLNCWDEVQKFKQLVEN